MLGGQECAGGTRVEGGRPAPIVVGRWDGGSEICPFQDEEGRRKKKLKHPASYKRAG